MIVLSSLFASFPQAKGLRQTLYYNYNSVTTLLKQSPNKRAKDNITKKTNFIELNKL